VLEFLFLPRELGLGLAISLLLARQRRRHVHLIVAIEERKKLIILALAERVVLVVVALGAADRQAEERPGGGGDAVETRLDAKLLLVGAALAVGQRVAVEARGGLLREGGAGQQIAGELLDGKSVKRQVAVERLDDPLAVAPGEGARPVRFIAVAVGVAGHVEP